MNPIISFTIPLNPTTKKNSQQIFWNKAINRPFITQSKTYKEYEKSCSRYIPDFEAISYPIRLKALYYRRTKHLVDLNGLNQALHDILVKYKLLADDNSHIVASTDGSRVYYDKDNPRTEIEIYNFTK